ncbi:IS3 family transposase [Piscirickettsia salmonis]|uniref:IS3 family transposase n=1 Tax=Piscirickettsia salmonis TaxID=1238 RepID=UPI0012BA9B4B|nr:IS3 family transposase [Piscirickettsia salmonis]
MGKRHVIKYTEEFKKSSAKLAVDSNQAISHTAQELGIHSSTLHGWVNKYHPNSPNTVKDEVSDMAAEIKQLKKELARVTQEREILKKAAALLCKRNTVKYAWIKENKCVFPVDRVCSILGVSRSGYYSWLKVQPSKRMIENQKLARRIKEIFIESRATYGTRRIRKQLATQEISVSRKRVGRLMKQNQLCCKIKRKFKVTTDSKHRLPIAKNVLDRNFSATGPNQKYVGDITYIRTQQGWLYLAVVIDLFSRKVVGWAMEDHMEASLVNDALLMALWKRKPKAGLIWHSDRGSQYASESHREILKDHQIKQSMSRKGDCWDNAVSESFFHTLKTELVHHMNFKNRQEAKSAIFEYIEVFYNRKRIHSANDYLSPEEYEHNQKIS